MRNPNFHPCRENNESIYSRIGFYMVRLEEYNLLMNGLHDETEIDEAIDVLSCWYYEWSNDVDNGTPLLRTYEQIMFDNFMRRFGLTMEDIPTEEEM